MIKFANEKDAVSAIVEAMKSDDETKLHEAWSGLHQSIADSVREDFEELQQSNDANVLAQRGYRQLTSTETAWYQKAIGALKSPNPKETFTALIGSGKDEDLMPNTIIEDVYKHLVEDHPLLAAINFQYVSYLTKWILNDHTAQTAVWGAINAEIVKEITSAFRVVDVTQNKLSAYAIIELDMLNLGPVFLDGYIRAVLSEAIYCGMEYGIVKGNGLNEPIGLIRDISADVSVSSSTGYPAKTQIEVTSFTPAEYGALIAQMAKTEKGRTRKFTRVTLLCNQTDYLTKVMPATTVLNSAGAYVNNLFPFPTDVIIVNQLDDGDAVVFIPAEYDLLVGGTRNGVIEYSDEYKFLEDQRTFKVKQYATGRAFDDTSALYLDISNLAPAYITVQATGTVTTKDETPTA